MAAEKHSSTRRRVLGAAVALPVLALAGGLPAPAVIASDAVARQSSGDRQRWNRRFARYRRLHTRWKAEAETGAYRAANDRYEQEKEAIEERFGSWPDALKSKVARPLMKAAFERVNAAENVYYERHTAPMYRAMTQLVQTPVPDLPALRTKLEIIREHEPDLFEDSPFHSFEMLCEDVVRLASE